jgi:hypothetical protein
MSANELNNLTGTVQDIKKISTEASRVSETRGSSA